MNLINKIIIVIIIVIIILFMLAYLQNLNNNIFCWLLSVLFFLFALMSWFVPRKDFILKTFFILIYLQWAILNYFDQSLVGRQGCVLLGLMAAIIFWLQILRDWPEKIPVPNLPVPVPQMPQTKSRGVWLIIIFWKRGR